MDTSDTIKERLAWAGGQFFNQVPQIIFASKQAHNYTDLAMDIYLSKKPPLRERKRQSKWTALIPRIREAWHLSSDLSYKTPVLLSSREKVEKDH
jgi:hypothetical protein